MNPTKTQHHIQFQMLALELKVKKIDEPPKKKINGKHHKRSDKQKGIHNIV